jgi:hypothetical protein
MGSDNTANGYQALFHNTTGANNTAIGVNALGVNTTGTGNTAIGNLALIFNDTGGSNTATGVGALFHNSTGDHNTANGALALSSNVGGNNNTAVGDGALSSNVATGFNTAVGVDALHDNTSGDSNTAIGGSALFNNNTGSNNIAVGVDAGLGVSAADHVICIGADGADVSNSCYIGQIFGQSVALGSGTPVLVDSDGKLGTVLSSRRFKHDIKPMDKASEAILALKPVTFQYKSDKTNTPQFGLIAEEVAQVNPDLAVRDKNGEILSVRYDQVNAMLLNEFLKEHKRVEELKSDFQVTVAEQQKEIQALTASVKEQAAQIQKVSAQLEVSKPATKVVLSNP